MAGSIEDRGNGSWRLNVNVGKGPDGKYRRKRKTVKAKNPSEAKILLAEFVTEIRYGRYAAPSNTRFDKFVEIWRKHAVKELAPSTVELYDYILSGHVIPAFAHYKMENITHLHINDYLESLESTRNDGKEGGLSSSSIQKHYNLLSGIFKLAIEGETIQTNPMLKVKQPKVTYKQGDAYSTEEVHQLLHLLNEEENKQQALIIRVAFYTGMRKGEILALQWDDIDLVNNTIHVRHSLSYTKEHGYLVKEPKTANSIRKVAPPVKLMAELKKQIAVKRTDRMQARELWGGGKYHFVFSSDMGKPLFPDVPNKWWARFLERTGMRKIRFHDLRHTAATYLINRGATTFDISKRLGHKDIGTTTKIYGHYLDEADQKNANLLNEDYI